MSAGYNKKRAERTCQPCGGFGGNGEGERHSKGDPDAYWVVCPTCGGSGKKTPHTERVTREKR